MTDYPLIDYERHPAFSDLGVRIEVDEATLRRQIEEIDAAYFELLDAPLLSAEKLRARFESAIARRIDALRIFVREKATTKAGIADYADSALARSTGFLFTQVEFGHWKRSQTRVPTPAPDEVERLAAMRRDGFIRYGVHRELAESVWRATEYERQGLVHTAQIRPWAHSAMSLHPFSKAVRLIRAAFDGTGFVRLASEYLGCEMEWTYCALDYAHPAQTWYRDCYADRGLPTSKTVYMHLDADPETIKAMLYLTDVSERQGPFGFVHGSPNWKRSPFLVAVHKGFDTEDHHRFPMEPDQLDYSLGYYRPRFKLEEYRKGLLSLPAPLRGSTHFGDDVLDDSDLSRRLLAEEVVFTGPAGSLILFDGSAGVHRGGQVVEGVRWAVQIALRAARSSRPTVKTAVADLLSRARYQAHLVKRRLTRQPAHA